MSSDQGRVPTNYFVCTLGEAIEKSSAFQRLETINDFIDHHAKSYPGDYAVGFARPIEQGLEQDWGHDLLTFQDLKVGSVFAAKALLNVVPRRETTSQRQCVALLCPSSIDFLFAWLGLMRAGSSVLLVAPQCHPAAIVHLCEACGVSNILHDTTYDTLATKAVSESKSGLQAVQIPWQIDGVSFMSHLRETRAQGSNDDSPPHVRGNAFETAFVFHTSGTSSGLPKPIPQSHHAAFQVLPRLDGRNSATFTTTPLYHGGIADCLRAWASQALIWLFPAAQVPITTRNILSCLETASKAVSSISTPPVAYFPTVPYILKMLTDDEDGVHALKRMKIVSVSGAALSPSIGDQLIERGVNLVSRFGSAECGFLLSSHRDYKTDHEWQYLRLPLQSKYLVFEESDNDHDVAELVVEKGWPHIAKSNREDGSYATSDLFRRHASVQGAWIYEGRSDSQVTLYTGQKFDPVPMEDFIAATSTLVREVLIFGNGRHRPGCLVFPSAEGSSLNEHDLKERVRKVVDDSNNKAPTYAKIFHDMITIMSSSGPFLEMSSKGTVLRGIAEKTFAHAIDRAYETDAVPTNGHAGLMIKTGDIHEMVQKITTEVVGHSLEDNADFYSQGVDSAACVRIRSLIKKRILGADCRLPVNLVYDCGNIKKLSGFVTNVKNGALETPTLDDVAEMSELAEKFTALVKQEAEVPARNVTGGPVTVLLTGATGAFGAHLLDRLCQDPAVAQIFCLVRAVDHYTARSRVSASLMKRKKAPLDFTNSKVWCAPCKLNEPDLGLAEMELSHLQDKLTHVIHAAWAVNFNLPLKSFVDAHITGLTNLLRLTMTCSRRVDFSFCSSTASVLSAKQSPVPEQISQSPLDASPVGYSKSKWVAESICARVAAYLPGSINVLRIGQLTGDTEHGVWNVSEAYPLMLMAGQTLNALPELKEPLSWVPMDSAATVAIELALRSNQASQDCNVYHIASNSTETTWMDLLEWTAHARAKPFAIVTPAAWLDTLENSAEKIPARNLLGFWRKAYSTPGDDREARITPEQTTFSTTNTSHHSEAMRQLPVIDRTIITKIWHWLEEEMKAAKVQMYVSRNRFDDR